MFKLKAQNPGIEVRYPALAKTFYSHLTKTFRPTLSYNWPLVQCGAVGQFLWLKRPESEGTSSLPSSPNHDVKRRTHYLVYLPDYTASLTYITKLIVSS